MKFLLGRKIEMNQKFREDGTVVPYTLVAAGPCKVTQLKNEEKDGYSAVQVSFEDKIKKEVRAEKPDVKVGDRIDVSAFSEGDKVKVAGTTKGRGFQGVVKRHGFHGSPGSHGHKDQHRMPGSIGATGPARVFKGMKMAGQMGNEQSTVSNLEIIGVNKEKNQLMIKGAVPGGRNGLILIYG